MADNTIDVVGNLVEDPQLRITPGGTAVCTLRIASSSRRYDKKKADWVDGKKGFIDVVAWGLHAECLAESLTRGMRVMARGEMTTDTYETREGEKRTRYELANAEVFVSLLGHVADLRKAGDGAAGRSRGNGNAGRKGRGRNEPAEPEGQQDPWAY
ncbi:single-stranded DNA-binding protein [Bailinhaonella thermotolerans]|uniref:single-stranded DNA-binding protein n=1 Tax=Bailinhaonella thermotolerans TaxID=1070861 RepID=UPI00192A4CA5|nr:single-stranded DNA-binding protein [Bailinhaonella thermotolerans]